jgi:hypothetical protein
LHHSLVPLIILLLFMAIPIVRIGLGNISELLSVLGDFVIWQNASSNNTIITIVSIIAG